MYYFAYGINVNADIMGKKGLFFLERRVGRLVGYRLTFNKQNLRPQLPEGVGFANIVEASEGTVEGVVYRLPQGVRSKLDRLERSPEHYRPIEVSVATDEATVVCTTYQAQPDRTAEGLIPSRNYINHMAASGVFSADYRRELEARQVYSGQCATCQRDTGVIFHKEAGRMYVLCPPCLEAKRIWGDVLGRALTVIDTEAVMRHVRRADKAYESIPDLIADAVELGLLDGPQARGSDDSAHR